MSIQTLIQHTFVIPIKHILHLQKNYRDMQKLCLWKSLELKMLPQWTALTNDKQTQVRDD